MTQSQLSEGQGVELIARLIPLSAIATEMRDMYHGIWYEIAKPRKMMAYDVFPELLLACATGT